MRLPFLLLLLAISAAALSKSDRKPRKEPTDSSEKPKKKEQPAAAKKTEEAEPLKFGSKTVTKKSILDNEQTIDSSERKFNQVSLAYITPWNGRGYDLAKWAAKKFTHIAPVWLQLRPQTADMAASCRIEGTHDIDHGWMDDVRSNNSEIKFLPRVLFEHWSMEDMQQFLASEAWSQRCLTDLLNFLKRNQFDGAVIELWMSTMIGSRGGAVQYMLEMLNTWGEAFHEHEMQIVVPVGPPLNDKNEPTGMFTAAMLQALYHSVDYVQVMTYDFPGGHGVAPYEWIRKTIQVLTENIPQNAERLLIGLNHYGYQYRNDGEQEAIQRNQFIEGLQQGSSKLEWDDKVKEHRLVTDESTSYFPSLTSIEMRLNLAKKHGIGIAIWELGQGLNYWTQLL